MTSKTVRVTWVKDRQFVGTDSSNHSVVMSSQDEDNATGMKPSDLLLVALGGCTAYDVVDILHKKRQRVFGVQVVVEAEQAEEAPWPYRRIHVHYRVRGQDVRSKAVEDAIELSESKYCSVAATLRPGVEISHDFEVLDA